jgi:hypothetical protein
VEGEEGRALAAGYGIGVGQQDAAPDPEDVTDDAPRHRVQEDGIAERRGLDLHQRAASQAVGQPGHMSAVQGKREREA